MANYWQKALNAVYYANPAKLREIIDGGNFPVRMLEDTGLLTNPLPVWRIPQLWESSVGDPSEWVPESQGDVRDFLKRVSEVKDLLAGAFGVEYTPVDYMQYTCDFFAANTDESPEDVLLVDDIAEASRLGARPVDVELYCAAAKFDFALTEKLLREGADPRAQMTSEDDSVLDRIGLERANLSMNLQHVVEPGQHSPVECQDVCDLVGSAAHEEMLTLLDRYAGNGAPLPRTARQAFAVLDGMFSEDERRDFAELTRRDFCLDQHDGLGLWIRNNWIFGGDEDCIRMLAGLKEGDLLLDPPDMVSESFLERYHDHLRRVFKK